MSRGVMFYAVCASINESKKKVKKKGSLSFTKELEFDTRFFSFFLAPRLVATTEEFNQELVTRVSYELWYG